MAAMIRTLFATLLLLTALAAQAACFEQAGQRYGIALMERFLAWRR